MPPVKLELARTQPRKSLLNCKTCVVSTTNTAKLSAENPLSAIGPSSTASALTRDNQLEKPDSPNSGRLGSGGMNFQFGVDSRLWSDAQPAPLVPPQRPVLTATLLDTGARRELTSDHHVHSSLAGLALPNSSAHSLL